MALEDYRSSMLSCIRCSMCKWVPGPVTKSWRFSRICPSQDRYKFHTYAGGGRVITALSVLTERASLSEEMVDIIYKCQMCGGCDVVCHMLSPLVEPLEIMRELRAKCISEGYVSPEIMTVIDNLKKEDTMMMGKKKADRGNWAEGLGLKDLTKEKAEAVFHVGCRLSYDIEQWPALRAAATFLREAGVDFGIMGKDEVCCGGRAYDLGYVGELTKYAENNRDAWRNAGVTKVIVACGDGYGALQNLYPKVLKDFDFEILHVSQYLAQLLKEDRFKPTKEIPMRVTYHDPCHLGRLGEHYLLWEGTQKRFPGPALKFDPPKPERHGVNGVYEPPREMLRSIPGLDLVEMDRNREYSYCCGAGGGVIDTDPEYARWTAKVRIEEAKATGAEAIVTSCPWCYRNLKDAAEEVGEIEVHDVTELLARAMGM